MQRAVMGQRRSSSRTKKTIPKRRAPWERSIVVTGNTYYWSVSIGWLATERSEATAFVEVRAAAGGATATLEIPALAVEYVFGGRTQNIAVGPRTVREIILEAQNRGWPTAAVSLPASSTQRASVEVPFDRVEQELRTACQKWFVPYPGRAALQAAYDEERGDVVRITARFAKLHVEQVERWLVWLGIHPKGD